MAIFTISLDFELLWGVFDKPWAASKADYFKNTREVIPRMLELFHRYGVEVTWATVGMLMAEDQEEWFTYLPEEVPDYLDKKSSPYYFVESCGLRPELHFAPELVQAILDTPGQEVGSHTYSHYYTQEEGQSLAQFTLDLQMAQKIAGDKFNHSLNSLVFPRNQYSIPYLNICKQEGFEAVRTNPNDWFWNHPESAGLYKRLFRSADTLFSMGQKTSYDMADISFSKELPILLPASRFYRPVDPKLPLVDWLSRKRVRHEMEFAAQNDQLYHLWWHPHNYGKNPKNNIKDLEELLKLYCRLSQEFGMESLHMGNVAERVKEQRKKREAVRAK